MDIAFFDMGEVPYGDENRPPGGSPAGLQNETRKTCYFNAVFQLMYNIKEIKVALMGVSTEGRPLLKEVQDTFTRLDLGLGPVCLLELVEMLGFPIQEMGDAAEALQKLVNMINQEVRSDFLSRLIGGEYNNSVDAYGQLEDAVFDFACLTCKPNCSDFDTSVRNCVSGFTEAGRRITKFHDILIVDIDRVTSLDGGRMVRLSNEFRYPADLDMKEFVPNSDALLKYRLKAVVVHMGSGNNSHYFTTIANENGTSTVYNDETVTEGFDIELLLSYIGNGQNESPVASLLVYRRVTDVVEDRSTQNQSATYSASSTTQNKLENDGVKLECEYCGKKYPTKKKLTRHQRETCEEKAKKDGLTFQCDCGKIFGTIRALKCHQKESCKNRR